MIREWMKKIVGVKIALFITVSLLFTVTLSLFVLSGLSQEFLATNDSLTLIALFLLFFIFFQTALVLLGVGLFVSRPIQKIIQSMKRVRQGDLLEKCDVSSSDELGELSDNFNLMLQSIKDSHKKRQDVETRLTVAEEGLKYKIALEEKTKIIERMNKELSSAFDDVSLLYTVSQYLNSVLDIDELISRVRAIFEDKFKCDSFALYFLIPKRNAFHLAVYKGLHEDVLTKGLCIQSNMGIVGKTYVGNRSVYINDLEKWSVVNRAASEIHFTGSVFSVPLRIRDTAMGVISVCRRQENGFSPTDRQSLESIASQLAVAFDRAQLYTKTRELSVRDELTGVFNRRYFHQMLHREFQRAKRYQRSLSLLMIDVDHFKQLNDTFGHTTGDLVLKKIAKLIGSNLREVDVLSRYGGEEFVVLLSDTTMSNAVKVANKLRKVIKNFQWSDIIPCKIDGGIKKADKTISIGVAAFPESVSREEDVIDFADKALYQAKKDGRDLVRTAPLKQSNEDVSEVAQVS